MITLGLTGGIGCGKTYISRIFAALGIPCYYSDFRTKALYNSNLFLRRQLVQLLGENVFAGDKLDTHLMASLVFSRPALLEKVNELVHPLVWEDFSIWAEKSSAPYVVFESALILELSSSFPFTRVLTVSSPKELRLERACRRDFSQPHEVIERMDRQWSDSQREEKADFILVSDEIQPLLPRVLPIHDQMMAIVEMNK